MNERVRHRLELQAIELEELFARNGVSAQIEGGQVSADAVFFVAHVTARISAQTERQLSADIEDTLPAHWIDVSLTGSRLLITMAPTTDLMLLPLLENRVDLSPGVALLGWSGEDLPLLLNFNERKLDHVVFLGAAGAGKTAALRTCAVSLSMGSRQSQVQMLFIDPQCDRAEGGQGPGLDALHYLPHALAAVVTGVEDAAEVLGFLQEEAEHRRAHNVRRPTIAVFVDNLDVLLREGSAALRDSMQALLARGASNGVHLIMAARPGNEGVGDDLAAMLALKPMLRVVGRVDSARQSQEASLVPQLGAENLLGRGDFLIVRDERAVRFQAAFVDSYDLHWCLETLQRSRPPALVAQPAAARPSLFATPAPDQAAQTFIFDGRRVLAQDVQAPRPMRRDQPSR